MFISNKTIKKTKYFIIKSLRYKNIYYKKEWDLLSDIDQYVNQVNNLDDKDMKRLVKLLSREEYFHRYDTYTDYNTDSIDELARIIKYRMDSTQRNIIYQIITDQEVNK